MAITSSDVLQSVADSLKKDVSDLEGYWSRMADAALEYAQQEVKGRLLKRAYTAAQVEAWDRYDEFVRDIALYRVFVLGGMLEAFDSRWVEMLDRRGELKSVQVSLDGVYVNPGAGGSAPGQVSAGNITSHGRGRIFDDGPDGESPIRW